MTITITEDLARALEILESGGNLFLTGKAGTGKSTLIRHFMEHTDRRVVVAAPTGIAALNVGGHTIHRLFGLLSTTTIEDIRSGRHRAGRFARTLKSLQTLIIDEASMVRADLFDQVAAALERYGPHPERPFGGVQVVLVGDLLQLPPVVPDSLDVYFATRYETPYFFSADSFDADVFPTVALTTVFRQLGDDRLTSLLNAVREGVLLDEARAELNSRVDPDFEPPEDELWLTLAPSNRIVSARNRQRLDLLPGEEFRSVASEVGDLSLFDPPTDRVLSFKVGAQVMMLTNDPFDRWANGTLGRIVEVRAEGEGHEAVVELSDGSRAEVGRFAWEVLRPVVEDGRLSSEVVGVFTQLPFKLAWAITIHKSQGQTLDRLVVDLSGGVFATGQVYVALSRATSLAGLVLKRPIEPRHLRTDRRILRHLHRSTVRGPAQHCAIAVCLVGDEGTFSRPRPVELAVAFEDGTAITTLINPERDLAGARTAYGISADDVLLAPHLAQAWATIAPLLEGLVPVGIGVDDTLGTIDFELKRLQRTYPMPIGVEVRGADLTEEERRGARSGRALDRATAALQAHRRLGAPDPGSPFEHAVLVEDEPSHLLSRDRDVPVPRSGAMATLSAIVEVSRVLGHAVLEGTHSGDPVPVDDAARIAAGSVVADRLAAAAARASRLSPELVRRLQIVETLLGVEFVERVVDAVAAAAPPIDEVLVAGTRVCFSGSALGRHGRVVSRDDMSELASRLGLLPVATVTKTRCDVLVVAEAGTQSGKARKARAYGTPVLTAAEFLAWADDDAL
ncbi:AAA family ATPase [Aeromicrobium choanae]|uniref:Helicase n=1 Tax=Aeromicrobium choanae TaxID=1736691 RepID=A0A1T4YTQ7_9ACTN|nr:AAA family ATPase [Aeromicrobium choanae]SKB05142.1 Helicase [Aeromicrobium choanae]